MAKKRPAKKNPSRSAAAKKKRRGLNALFGSRKRAGMAIRSGVVRTGHATRASAQLRHKMTSSSARRWPNPGKVKTYSNPAKLPKGWVKADKVRVVKRGGKKVLEVFRKPTKRRR